MHQKTPNSIPSPSNDFKIFVDRKQNHRNRISLSTLGDQTAWTKKMRLFDDRIWRPHQKRWSIPFTLQSITQLKDLFGHQLHFTFDWEVALKEQEQQQFNPFSKVFTQKQTKIKDQQKTYEYQNRGRYVIKIDQKNNQWLNLQVPYQTKGWIEIIKTIPGRLWNPQEKQWRVPYVKESLSILQSIGDKYLKFSFVISSTIPECLSQKKVSPKPRPIELISEEQQNAITQLEERLTLERKSWRTIKSYRTHLIDLFFYHKALAPELISEQQIQDYLLTKINKQKIAESTQNQIINALKAYYERVLDQQEKVKWIPRPKKVNHLPNVLSLQEIEVLINHIENIKHKTMISLIYSAGLRKGELLNLRIKDFIFCRNCIYIKAAKGKKDRFVGLAPTIVDMIRAYRKIYFPRYWIFEGQKGGQYSETSLQCVFNNAKLKSGVNPYVTLHGLRHSYATHLVEHGIPLIAVKDMLGHNSIKTTEIYLHLSNKFMKNIQSPIELLNLG